MDCQGLRTRCQTCGYEYSRREPGRKSDKTCKQCGADRACGKQAVRGYRFCESHGGPNPKNNFYGMGNGIVNGRGSDFKLTQIASKYNEIQRNGAILTNRKSIEVVRDRLEELLTRVDARQIGDRLVVLYKLWQKYTREMAKGDEVDALKTRREIDDEFDKVYHDYNSWEQIMQVIDLDRKLVESEVKIAKDLNAILTAEDAFELVAQVFAAIMRHVNDPKILQAIQYELTRIVGDRSPVEAETSYGDNFADE